MKIHPIWFDRRSEIARPRDFGLVEYFNEFLWQFLTSDVLITPSSPESLCKTLHKFLHSNLVEEHGRSNTGPFDWQVVFWKDCRDYGVDFNFTSSSHWISNANIPGIDKTSALSLNNSKYLLISTLIMERIFLPLSIGSLTMPNRLPCIVCFYSKLCFGDVSQVYSSN